MAINLPGLLALEKIDPQSPKLPDEKGQTPSKIPSGHSGLAGAPPAASPVADEASAAAAAEELCPGCSESGVADEEKAPAADLSKKFSLRDMA